MSTKEKLRAVLDATRPYPKSPDVTLTDKEIHGAIFYLLFVELIPSSLGECNTPHTTGYFDRYPSASMEYDEEAREELERLTKAIQDDFDRTHVEYVAARKRWSLAVDRVHALEASASPNPRAIDEAQAEADRRHVPATEAFARFMDARLAEEYVRLALPTYVSQDLDDALFAIAFILRTDLWNTTHTPRRTDNHASVTALFETIYG